MCKQPLCSPTCLPVLLVCSVGPVWVLSAPSPSPLSTLESPFCHVRMVVCVYSASLIPASLLHFTSTLDQYVVFHTFLCLLKILSQELVLQGLITGDFVVMFVQYSSFSTVIVFHRCCSKTIFRTGVSIYIFALACWALKCLHFFLVQSQECYSGCTLWF